MAPLRGWGTRGQRLEATAPYGHWKTVTFIAALRHDRISASWVIDGPINGELFTLYIERALAPTLAKGEIVILDNLGSHKGKSAREAIRAKGAHLLSCLPTVQTSIRLNRSSPSSNICCELPNQETSKPVGGRSSISSTSSPKRMRQYHPGICCSGLRVNRSGSFVQALQMYSFFLSLAFVAERANERSQSRWRLPPAGVIEIVAGEGRAPPVRLSRPPSISAITSSS